MYNPIENEERWKITMAQEIIEIKNRNLEVDNFRREELEEMLEFLCISSFPSSPGVSKAVFKTA